jgi:cation transport ATPase
LLLTHPQVLERAVNMDTVVFDGRLLHDTCVGGQFAASVQALQQQARRVYVFTEADDALCALAGVDECFNAVTADERVAWIHQWQAAGKQVCYVGSGAGDSAACQVANLSVVVQAVLPATLPTEDLPDAFLLGTDLQAVPHLFALAAAFGDCQRFNLLAPMGVDVVDISTTLLLDFGLVYSVMFTYVGLLLGMGRTHWRKPQALPANRQSLPASLPA